jgi:hypothetical protein
MATVFGVENKKYKTKDNSEETETNRASTTCPVGLVWVGSGKADS